MYFTDILKNTCVFLVIAMYAKSSVLRVRVKTIHNAMQWCNQQLFSSSP